MTATLNGPQGAAWARVRHRSEETEVKQIGLTLWNIVILKALSYQTYLDAPTRASTLNAGHRTSHRPGASGQRGAPAPVAGEWDHRGGRPGSGASAEDDKPQGGARQQGGRATTTALCSSWPGIRRIGTGHYYIHQVGGHLGGPLMGLVSPSSGHSRALFGQQGVCRHPLMPHMDSQLANKAFIWHLGVGLGAAAA